MLIMLTIDTDNSSWPAPPVDKPKPVEKPKPVFPNPVPQRFELGGGYAHLLHTPFICPYDVMLYPQDYRITAAQADSWLRCMEVW